MHTSRLLLCLCAGLSAISVASAAEQAFITISAGDLDREQSVVTFDLPTKAREFHQLRGADGKFLPLQIDAQGHASFIEPRLKKGGSKTYELEARKVANAGSVAVKQAGKVLKITVDGKPVTQYQMQPSEVPSGVKEYFSHGAYLHPVTSPSGKLITGDYSADHRWHRGIWLGWTDTEFEGRHPDFWNMGKEKDGKFTGSVEFEALDHTWNGPVHGGFVSKHRFIDWTSGQPKPVLNETWNVTVYRTGDAAQPRWVFDLTSTQTCATSTPLNLPKYHYGGLGVRGNAQWDPASNVSFITSNGDDRLKGDSSKGNWVHMGGKVDGQPSGMAILCSPDNFRAPQPMRLNPKNPQLCWAPSQDGDWQITPGKPYVSKYRFIVADGAPDKAALDKLWEDYAHPMSVKVDAK